MEQERSADEQLDEAVEDMQSDAEGMQERSEKLGDAIEDAESDWHAKQQDDAVPGAQPPPDEKAEHPPGQEPADGGNGDSGQQLEYTSGEEKADEQPEETSAEQPE
jgi:hypothetical protein